MVLFASSLLFRHLETLYILERLFGGIEVKLMEWEFRLFGEILCLSGKVVRNLHSSKKLVWNLGQI